MASIPNFHNTSSETGTPSALNSNPQAQFHDDKPIGQTSFHESGRQSDVDQPLGGVGDTKSYEVTTIGRGGGGDPQQGSEYVSEERSDGRKVQMLGHHTIGDRIGGGVHEIGESTRRESDARSKEFNSTPQSSNIADGAGSYESTTIGRAPEIGGVASQDQKSTGGSTYQSDQGKPAEPLSHSIPQGFGSSVSPHQYDATNERGSLADPSQGQRDHTSAGNGLEGNNADGATRGHTSVQPDHTGPSLTEKLKGKVEKAAGKVAGNEAMIQRGEERQVGGGSH